MTPVSAGSHSNRCVRSQSQWCAAMSRCQDVKSVDDGQCFVVVEGCAMPIKIGGVFFWGAEGGRMDGLAGEAGSDSGPNTYRS